MAYWRSTKRTRKWPHNDPPDEKACWTITLNTSCEKEVLFQVFSISCIGRPLECTHIQTHIWGVQAPTYINLVADMTDHEIDTIFEGLH